MNYSTDRQWSDKWIPRIRSIVGPHLLIPSDFRTDTEQAADLIVLKGRDMTIAARVRRFGFLPRYQHEFTIRSQRDNGSKTELQKITDGWADWMFYAHSNENETDFDLWWLIDMDAWRAHMIRRDQGLSYGQKSNGDGTYFTWFSIPSFPLDPPLIIANSKESNYVGQTLQQHV